MDIKKQLAEEFNIPLDYSTNIVNLIADGNTIPFIARYRKEMHGAMDDQLLRSFADRLEYLLSLQKRKEEIQAAIEGLGAWTDELKLALDNAKTLTEAEDIYRPYKQKKKTRASVAIERGLEPLAYIIFAQELQQVDLTELAAPYVSEEKGVPTTDDAINGAMDIIAERISDDAAIRKNLRAFLMDEGVISSAFDAKQTDESKKGIYENYSKFAEPVKTLPDYRVLALNRGEKEECLKVTLSADEDKARSIIATAVKKSSAFDALIDNVIADAYDRLIFPSIEREVRNELTDRAAEQAIKMFEVNLKPLLMQPPLKGKVIMGLDPAYRTGCKIAVIDSDGNFLDKTVVYPTPPQSKTEEAKAELKNLIYKYNVDVISIGNGTASKESEIFVAELIKELDRPVTYAVVNEAGASVYSAGKAAAEEFPDLDLTFRSAISIARRLLDPLSELIKIDVQSIGVGQYQHDMPQKRLTSALTGVVEDCVNSVGVNLNTASYALLAHVAGLNTGVAKNVVEFRKTSHFSRRDQLLKVPKLGKKAFEQCAGFLRLPDGENVLDNTAVHPESYEAANKLLNTFGYGEADVREGKLGELKTRVNEFGAEKLAKELGIGVPTLNDIVDELMRPGRDIREQLPPPVLRSDVLSIKDLKPDMWFTGTVRNVIDFGAFIDIGVHQDGLAHISELCDRFVKHPSEVLKVGDIVRARVISVDTEKNRISLSLKNPEDKAKKEKVDAPRPDRDKNAQKQDFNKNRPFNRNDRRTNKFDRQTSYHDNRNDNNQQTAELSYEEKLKALAAKFNK